MDPSHGRRGRVPLHRIWLNAKRRVPGEQSPVGYAIQWLLAGIPDYIHVELTIDMECDSWMKKQISDTYVRGNRPVDRCIRLGHTKHMHRVSLTAGFDSGPYFIIDRLFETANETTGDRDYEELSYDIRAVDHRNLCEFVRRMRDCDVVIPVGPSTQPREGHFNYVRGFLVGHMPLSDLWSALVTLGVRIADEDTPSTMEDKIMEADGFFCSEFVLSVLLTIPDMHYQFKFALQANGLRQPFCCFPDDCVRLFDIVGKNARRSYKDYADFYK